MSVFRWKMLDRHSLATYAAACQAVAEEAGLQLVGGLELLGVEGYEDQQPQLALPTSHDSRGAAITFSHRSADIESGTIRWSDVLSVRCKSVICVNSLISL